MVGTFLDFGLCYEIVLYGASFCYLPGLMRSAVVCAVVAPAFVTARWRSACSHWASSLALTSEV